MALLSRLYDRIRRSFSEFLAIPVAAVAIFVVGALLVSMLDASAGDREQWSGWRSHLDAFIGDPRQATNLISTIATSLVTMSSITFSILLLAVQQSSAALTNQIVDQYIRRRANQAFFGFFVGSSLFALTCLGLTKHNAVPVLAATACLVLAALCLCLLVVLIYSTLDQTRPSSIISTIHNSTLRARARQQRDLERTSARPLEIESGEEVYADAYGYVVAIDFSALIELAEHDPHLVIIVERPLGANVYCGELVATVAGAGPLQAKDMARIRRAVRVAPRRELLTDPTFGVDQLSDIAWTAVSTAKSNPAAGLVAIHALNDLLFRWGRGGSLICQQGPNARVVCRDTLIDHLARAYESLMVVASESMQQQSLAEILRGISLSFEALPAAMQDMLERSVLGSLSALGDHVATDILGMAVHGLEEMFRRAGRASTAKDIAQAWGALARSRGTLHSRSDRVAQD
jgi:uncharacterized membrane protein